MTRIGDAIVDGAIYTAYICLGALYVCVILSALLGIAAMIGWWAAVPVVIFVGATAYAYLSEVEAVDGQ